MDPIVPPPSRSPPPPPHLRKRPMGGKGKAKIEIAYIQDRDKRHLCFTKRKSGLLKKAANLHHMCGTDVLVIAATDYNVYTYASPKFQSFTEGADGQAFLRSLILKKTAINRARAELVAKEKEQSDFSFSSSTDEVADLSRKRGRSSTEEDDNDNEESTKEKQPTEPHQKKQKNQSEKQKQLQHEQQQQQQQQHERQQQERQQQEQQQGQREQQQQEQQQQGQREQQQQEQQQQGQREQQQQEQQRARQNETIDENDSFYEDEPLLSDTGPSPPVSPAALGASTISLTDFLRDSGELAAAGLELDMDLFGGDWGLPSDMSSSLELCGSLRGSDGKIISSLLASDEERNNTADMAVQRRCSSELAAWQAAHAYYTQGMYDDGQGGSVQPPMYRAYSGEYMPLYAPHPSMVMPRRATVPYYFPSYAPVMPPSAPAAASGPPPPLPSFVMGGEGDGPPPLPTPYGFYVPHYYAPTAGPPPHYTHHLPPPRTTATSTNTTGSSSSSDGGVRRGDGERR